MRAKLIGVTRTLTAVVLGYIVLVLASTFVQEYLFHGVSYHRSPLSTLIGAGILTPFSGVLAGLTTAAIAGRAFVLHVVPVCVWISIETSILYARHIVDGPLWFEGSAGLMLIAGCVAGALVWREIIRRRTVLAAA